MPVDHYENFPVASILLPRHLRRPVELIYAFARQADDFADEGDLADEERLGLLDGFRTQLRGIESGALSSKPLFNDLAAVIRAHCLLHTPLEKTELLGLLCRCLHRLRLINFLNTLTRRHSLAI